MQMLIKLINCAIQVEIHSGQISVSFGPSLNAEGYRKDLY